LVNNQKLFHTFGTAFFMTDPSVQIRQAGPPDTDTIVSLSRTTFRETYGSQNTQENMDIHLDEHFNLGKIRQELTDPVFRFYLSFLEGKPVGFMKLRSDRQPRGVAQDRCLEIQRIYVLQEFQGASIGSELMKMAKDIARREGFSVVWLQVWQKNDRAIHFYQKSGFVIYETSTFLLGRELQQDYLMRFDLYI
jgi:ribosomal protein S18 acetylase RimI-like enzyme